MTLPTITAVGRLGADPELRFTPSGKAVADFRIACDERKEQNGEWKTTATVWLGVSVWENDAETVAEHLKKGDLVTVIGNLITREYEAKDGSKRLAVEIKNPRVTKALPKTKSSGTGAPIQQAAANPWDTQQQAGGGSAWGTEEPPF